jgi:signal transduction histidine kinase
MGEVSTDLRLVLNRHQQLRLHVALSAGLALILVAIWIGSGGGYFWPQWPILVISAAISLHVLFRAVPPDRRRWFRGRATRGFVLHVGLTAIVSLMLIAIWSFAGGGYFWPGWPMLAFAITIGLHWLFSLTQRIDYLEVSRTDAVDMQQSDLSRIERDLHDGAQARLVALGMNLGMAEQKFATDPDGARLLVSEAREGVGDALKELRDLVRGIRPPVLADRGLAAAITSLADRTPIPVHVVSTVEPRPSEAVETAAYFVVAESLTNAAKHARANRIDVRLQRLGSSLQVEISDNGQGGADVAGHGLSGLRRRVEALDGHLFVTSPRGGPTIIRAEIPCER